MSECVKLCASHVGIGGGGGGGGGGLLCIKIINQ
jgi:hypothetical protein